MSFVAAGVAVAGALVSGAVRLIGAIKLRNNQG